jgi:hypothetical protein
MCICCCGYVFIELLPDSDRGIHIQTHKDSRLTAEELLEVVFSLQYSSRIYRVDISVLWLAYISCVEAGSNTSIIAL